MCFWITLILLAILLLITPPYYSYSRRWGYIPVGAILAILLILLSLWYFAWLPGWYYPYPPP